MLTGWAIGEGTPVTEGAAGNCSNIQYTSYTVAGYQMQYFRQRSCRQYLPPERHELLSVPVFCASSRDRKVMAVATSQQWRESADLQRSGNNGGVRQTKNKWILASSCLSVRPHGTTRAPTGRIFTKFDIWLVYICRESSSIINP